jgi:hypothetical protein
MTVFFRPCGDITKAPTPRSMKDVDLYTYLSEVTELEITIDETVDYEDWMEPACMLFEAIETGLEVLILPRRSLREAVMNPIARIDGRPCRDMLIGRQVETDPMEMQYFDLGWPSANDYLPNHYAELETFQANAGRRLRLADMPGDSSYAGGRTPVFGKGLNATALGDAMAAFAPGSIIIKQVYPGKSMPLVSYDLEPDFKASEGEPLFFDKMGFHFARFEGDPAALLVQEKITMTHETRFFVIDGKVVTGAACIENHTPQQRTQPEDVLPPVWEIERSSGLMDERPYMERKRTAVTLWNFAWDIATKIAKEAPELDAYALDLALDANGEPLIIEMNPAASSGIYANNAELLFEAIHAYAEAAPRQEPKEWNPCAFVGLVEKSKRGLLNTSALFHNLEEDGDPAGPLIFDEAYED